MRSLKNNQRVRCIKDPLAGKTGTVVRPRIGDNGAWVQMDEDLPEDLRSFSPPDSRCRNIVLYPEECEPIEATT